VSEHLALGMPQHEGLVHGVTVYGFLCLVFAFNTLCFIPLGHLAARLMTRLPALTAYSWNLIGSLAGILLFTGLSYLWSPPTVWVLITALVTLAFLRKHLPSVLAGGVATAALLALIGTSFQTTQHDVYTPYQVVSVSSTRNAARTVLQVNNVYYQRMLDLRPDNVAREEFLAAPAAYYGLPYRVKQSPAEVLVVGSGSGNDVAAALRNGAGRIDAVEIDPVILELGRRLHPEAPLQSPNVRAIVDDARSFIRKTDETYDLIVYGLLDSHTLLSGRAGVRLDSYVYTVEAFREARARLKPDGVISMTFALMGDQMGRKLYLMLEEAFDGRTPLIFKTGYDGGYAFLIGDSLDPSVSAEVIAGTPIVDATGDFANEAIVADKAVDDWPFFYMPVRKYPVSYVVMIVFLLFISSMFVRGWSSKTAGNRLLSAPFFLGAGFMLVETKGITELALVYGSTWLVIGVVIAAILILAFLANLLVIRVGTPPRTVTYGLLFATLAAGWLTPSSFFAGVEPWLARLAMTILVMAPLFFSGFAFSTELRLAPSMTEALSANLLGAMVGGFLEYNSMYFGFRSLYVLAFLMYALALAASFRRGQTAETSVPQRDGELLQA